MDWDVDELLTVARVAGFLPDADWTNEERMDYLRQDTEYKLKQGWIPDLEYGKWIRPEDVK